LWATALGGVRVMVPASYVPQALRAIAAIEHGELRLEDEGGEDEEDDDGAGAAEASSGAGSSSRSRLPRQAAALLLLFALLELLARPGSWWR